MAEDSDLADFLKSQRHNDGPCWCESAPPEITAQVNAALNKASAEGSSPQWTAIGRWLSQQLGEPIVKNGIQKHRERGHLDR